MELSFFVLLLNAFQLNQNAIIPISMQADVERDFAADKFGLKTFPTLVLLPKSGKSGEQGAAASLTSC